MSTSGGGDDHHIDSPYRMMDGGMDEICADGTGGFGAHSWTGAWHDGKEELRVHWREVYDDIFHNEENSWLDKFLLTAELPFTIMRKSSVPIPCEGILLPCSRRRVFAPFTDLAWNLFLYLFFDTNLFWLSGFPYILILCSVTAFAAVCIMRYAPGGDGNMNLLISGPIALYGFVIAATWIDAIADRLVSLLNFLGVVCHIPSSIMGLTILAWGNSMADLAANVTMAKKGLANMAMTACFAGPVFNILIGLRKLASLHWVTLLARAKTKSILSAFNYNGIYIHLDQLCGTHHQWGILMQRDHSRLVWILLYCSLCSIRRHMSFRTVSMSYEVVQSMRPRVSPPISTKCACIFIA